MKDAVIKLSCCTSMYLGGVFFPLFLSFEQGATFLHDLSFNSVAHGGIPDVCIICEYVLVRALHFPLAPLARSCANSACSNLVLSLVKPFP